MAKALKFLFFLVVLLLIGVGALFLLVDPNAYKTQIVQLVEAQTGRQLTIRDDFSLSFFPWVGVRLGALELGNAPGFGPEPFAKIASANLRVKWEPLLQRRVEVDTITIQGLHLNLAENSTQPAGSAGANNWSDLLRQPRAEPKADSEKTAQTAASTSPTGGDNAVQSPLLAAIAVEGVHLLDAHLSWRDVAKNSVKTVDISELTSGPLRENRPVSLTMQLHYKTGEAAPLEVDLALQGTFVVQLAAKQMQVKPLHIQLTGQGKQIPTGKRRVETTLELLLDGQKETMQVANLQMTGEGLQLSGQMDGQKMASAPRITGTVTLRPFPLRTVLQEWGVALSPTHDPKALGSLDGVIPFTADRNSLTLANVQLNLDESRLHGQLAVQDFSHPAIRGDLTLDMLDLDRYRAAIAATKEQTETRPPAQTEATKSTTQPSSKQEGMPIEALRTLDLAGRLRITNLKAANLSLQDVDLSLQSKNGILQLSPAKARLYQGGLWMELLANVQGTLPKMTLEGRLEGVQMGELLQDLNGQDPVNGLATIKTNLTTTGDTVKLVKSNLNGKAQFSLKEGAIKGVDIAKLLDDAAQVLEGHAVTNRAETGATAFTTLDGSVTIKNGLVDNRDLVLTSSLLRVQGAGTLNLPTDQVDYQLQASVPEALQGKGGRTVTTLTGVTIPVQATGSLTNLAWQLDIKKLLEQSVAKKAKEKLGDKIQDKAMNLLKKNGLENVLPADFGKRLLDGSPFR